MEAARAEKQADQDEKEKEHAELLKNIARLEDELARKDAKERTGDRPKPKPHVPSSNSSLRSTQTPAVGRKVSAEKTGKS